MDSKPSSSQLDSLSDAYVTWAPAFWGKSSARAARLAQDDTWDSPPDVKEVEPDPLSDAGKAFPVLGLMRSTSFRSWLTFAATVYITVSWVQADFRLQRLNFNRELLLLLSAGVACWWQPSATRRRLRSLLCRLAPQHAERERLLSSSEQRVRYGMYSRSLVVIGAILVSGSALGVANDLAKYPQEVALHSFSASLGALEQANVLRFAVNKTDDDSGPSGQGCDVTLDLTTMLSPLTDWGCYEFAKDGTPGLLKATVEITLSGHVSLVNATGWSETNASNNQTEFAADYQVTGKYFPPLVVRYNSQPEKCAKQFVQRARTRVSPKYWTHCRMPEHATLALGSISLETENLK